MFFPNKPDEDWYWPVEILEYTSAFFTLFDLSLCSSLFNFNSVFAVFLKKFGTLLNVTHYIVSGNLYTEIRPGSF